MYGQDPQFVAVVFFVGLAFVIGATVVETVTDYRSRHRR